MDEIAVGFMLVALAIIVWGFWQDIEEFFRG